MSRRSNGPQAQPLAHALLERVMMLSRESLSPSTLDLVRLKSEAESLLKTDAAGAHDVLGAVACLRQRPTEARYHHEIAARVGGNEEYIFNYGTSLARMGCFEEAIARYSAAFDLDPYSIETARVLTQANLDSGHVTEAERWLEELSKRTPEGGTEMAAKVRGVRAFLDEYGVAEAELQALVSRCIGALHEENIWALKIGLWLNDEDEQLVVGFQVPHEADLCALMEAIASSLAEDEILAEAAGRVIPFFHREHKETDRCPSLHVIF